jgi:hypothetical protein
MVEAVRTTASPTAIWAIVVVAVVCLAFWLIAVAYADAHPYVRQQRLPDMPGPVLGGMDQAEGGRSVAPNRDSPAEGGDLADLAAATPGAGQPGAAAEASQRQVPGQRGPQAPAEPVAARGAEPGPRGEGAGDAPTEPIPAQRGAPADTEAANRAGRGR